LDKIDFISPYIRIALDSVITPPWRIKERVIFDYELLYVKSGHVIITIEDVDYQAKSGSVFLFKPGQRHAFNPLDNGIFHQPHLHFDLFCQENSNQVDVSFQGKESMSSEELLMIRSDDTASGSPMELPSCLHIGNIVYFEELLFQIIREFGSRMPFAKIQLKCLFLRLWAYILRENSISQGAGCYFETEEYRNIREYIEYNADRIVTLDELSDRFHICKYHLLRQYQRIYGTTPIQHSRRMRIEKTKEQLIYSGMSISEIAELHGFGSVNAFSRAFYQIVGVSPSVYRKGTRR
jgi:AraC-like DNA-binding protein